MVGKMFIRFMADSMRGFRQVYQSILNSATESTKAQNSRKIILCFLCLFVAKCKR